jgi:hypothetical protein
MRTKHEEKLISLAKDYMINFKQVYNIFIEMLLTKGDDEEMNDSVKQYLMNTKWIHFEIQSTDQNMQRQQFANINKILRKCQKIEEIRIDLHRVPIDGTIELKLSTHLIEYIYINICNGNFVDNQLNMVSICDEATANSKPPTIHIRFDKCQFTIDRLMAFAAFVDRNVKYFSQRIYFFDIFDAPSLIAEAIMNEKRFLNISFARRSSISFVIVRRISTASRLVSIVCDCTSHAVARANFGWW